MEKIYPISYIENILNSETGENLYVFLSVFNHINIGYVESRESARNAVPEVLRKQGLYITYYLYNTAITEYYDGNKALITEGDNWIKDINWKQINAIVSHGNSNKRPDNVAIGTPYFDTEINKTIWWDGEKWTTYPNDVKVIKRIKKTDIISTHRRCVDCDIITEIPSNVSDELIQFDKIKKIAIFDNVIYLIDFNNKIYNDCHSIQYAHIFIHIEDKYYYLEEDITFTEITENNIDDYVLPVIGDKCPYHGSVNPYENGTVFTVNKGFEVVMLIAFPNRFYGKIVEPYLNSDDYDNE